MLVRLIKNIKGDRQIWTIVLILAVVSLMVVYSSTRTLAYRYQDGNNEYYLFKHFFILLLGLGITFVTHLIDHRYFSRVAQLMMFLSIPLLLYTLVFGVELNDAKRWVTLPIINLTFQTSDFAKLSLIMYTSRMLSKKQGVIKDFKSGFLPIILPIIAIVGLIMPENLSSAAILMMTNLIIMFIGRVNIKYISATIGMGVLLLGVVILVGYLSPDKGRIMTWKSRIEEYAGLKENTEPSYQIQQANIAIANGGIVRLAPGKCTQCNFLPHPYSDYIYATIIEEYGLLGGAFIIFLYLWLLYRIIKIVKDSPRAFGALMAVGLGMSLVIQAFINMGVTVNLLPVTGLTLPFISMGGTSIWFNGFALGIILSVSRNIEDGKQSKRTILVDDEVEHVGRRKRNNSEELPV
ncbi:MAG: FtsW/RodA/SpoVE family cell cycle protein [Chitinophagales bacterium]|nr:FtsW/RodA/SpoVE family cell cycle protein [Chitinophagales bacterium]